MYQNRYEEPRNQHARGPSFLPHVFREKNSRPDIFCQELRVTPATFDKIIQELETDPVFSNDANTSQMPVEHQVAITLWRFVCLPTGRGARVRIKFSFDDAPEKTHSISATPA